MKDRMNLQQTIYSFLVTQIQFGAYRYGDSLPSIEEASQWFSVSTDTIRGAYLQLKKERFITLTKRAGAIVNVEFSKEQSQQYIQTFFSQRREAVLDLCGALGPMFHHAQWLAMKLASQEQLDTLERLCVRSEIAPVHRMIRQTRLIYGTLNNDLLLRLIWQAFLFFQGPFFSLPQNREVLDPADFALLSMTSLCRQKDWSRLWTVSGEFQTRLFSGIRQFYEDSITADPSLEPIPFCWHAYEHSSQHRYSLAIQLLKDIRQGIYPEETLLPTPARLAQARQVSVITIRRTLALLNQLGATTSINGIGTQVLKTEDSLTYCDFSQPALQKRLLDFAQSLQILALTCKEVSQITLEAMEPGEIRQWKEKLLTMKQRSHHESVVFASLEVLSRLAPLHSVREIYGQLLQILLWGYPLRGMHGSREEINRFYLPYIELLMNCLERRDWAKLGTELEMLLCYEANFAITHLERLGISQVSGLVIPDLPSDLPTRKPL